MYAWIGSFFERYPRHDMLISINKRHTGKTNVEFNLRHDWNSLVTDVDDEQAAQRFGAYSRQLFPQRHELIGYLNDFVNKSRLKVIYDTDITNITRISHDTSSSSSSRDKSWFTMTDQRQQVYNCRWLPFFCFKHFAYLTGFTRLCCEKFFIVQYGSNNIKRTSRWMKDHRLATNSRN